MSPRLTPAVVLAAALGWAPRPVAAQAVAEPRPAPRAPAASLRPAGPPAAQADRPATGLPAAGAARVEAALDAARERYGVPGLSAAIALHGEVVWAAGLGLADVENEVPAEPATVYRLASVSKPITAVAVLQLADRGALDLDAPIWKSVPAFPEKPWPVTARLLLSHLGGVRHYADGEMASTRHYASLAEGIGIFANDPLAAEPGTRYLYSTHGYTLLGAAVEAASGTGFLAYLRERVFEPAGMASARDDDVAAIIPHRARGYRRAPDGVLRNCEPADTSYKLPGGGLVASAPDVARFGAALLSGRLLPGEWLERMLTPARTRDGRTLGYGLGLALARERGLREAYHTGSQQGVRNILYTQPDRSLVVALLTNLEDLPEPARLEIAREVAGIVAPR